MSDIIEQIKEKLSELWGQVQESSAYNTLMEKYHSLPQNGQKAVHLGLIGVALLVVLMVPFSFLSSSWDNVDLFENDRQLIRDLFRASSSKGAGGPVGIKVGQAVTIAQTTMGTLGLLPEQIINIGPLPPSAFEGKLSKPPVIEAGFGVQLKKLNLDQVREAGYRLQRLGPGVKLVGMDMLANGEDDHYYDVTFKLMTFSLPEEPVEEAGDKKPKRGKSRFKRKSG